MTRIDVLLDSSFLYAINSPNDRKHPIALKVATLAVRRYIVPDIVLAETAYMLRRHIGQVAVDNFLDGVVNSVIELSPILKSDLKRAREILSIYREADFDLADCCIMAQAERLNITHVCTFDERDFRQFRPLHCPYFQLLPMDL